MCRALPVSAENLLKALDYHFTRELKLSKMTRNLSGFLSSPRVFAFLPSCTGVCAMPVFICLLLLSSSCLVVLASSAADSESSTVPNRKADLLFNTSTLLRGLTVTCDNSSDADYKFPAETWSCYNMQIDGLRLRSYYTRDIKTNLHCTDDVTGKNDIAALCREMLSAHNILGDLWSALIVKNPTCTDTAEERMMFLKSNKSLDSYEWVRFAAGRGFIYTLRCMLIEKK